MDERASCLNGLVSPCFITLTAKYAELLIGQMGAGVQATRAIPTLAGYYASKIIKPNNGIQKRNLDVLAKPLGLAAKLEENCEDLFGPLNALGSRRGAVAHLGNVEVETRPAAAR